MIDEEAEQAFQRMRIAVMAMALGIVCFGAVTIFLVAGGNTSLNAEPADTLLIVLAVVVISEIPAYVVIRNAITVNLRRTVSDAASEEMPTEQIIGGFTRLTLIGSAMAEGAGLFGLVVLLVTGNWLAIIVPAAGLALLALRFPTRRRLDGFRAGVTGRYGS